jgi:hypothetical protein
LDELEEQDFKKPLQGDSTNEDKARFPECFQSLNEDEVSLNRVTEDSEDILKGKEPTYLLKEEILKKQMDSLTVPSIIKLLFTAEIPGVLLYGMNRMSSQSMKELQFLASKNALPSRVIMGDDC